MKRLKFPLCRCGCGVSVTRLKNQYLYGHNLKHISPESEQIRRKKIGITTKKRYENPEEIEKCRIRSTGRYHSEKTKQLLSILRTGEGNGMFGKHPSKESIQKQLKSREGYHPTQATKDKIGKANSLKIRSKLTKDTISNTLKEFYRIHENPFKDKHHTKESTKKISKALYGKYRGEKASNWQGGLSSLPYAKGWSPWFIEEIRNRDNHQCQNPKCKNPHKLLDIHHIDYNKKNPNLMNLITLCKRCHGRTQKYREYWKSYYQRIMREKQNIVKRKRTT